MATVQAPRRAPLRTEHARPLPTPRREPQQRPSLRIVREVRRQPNYALLTVLGIGAIFAALFGLVVFHTVLLQNQQRLDHLDGQVRQQQAKYQQLRLEVAQLQSPQRIIDVATTKLGLVPSDGTTYLTPSGADAAAARDAQAASGADPTDPATGGNAWPQVKPYLGAAP